MKRLLHWSKDNDRWIGRTTNRLYSNCHLSYTCTEHNAGTDQRYYTVTSLIRRYPRIRATVRKLADGKELCEVHAQQQLGPPQ